MIGEYNTPKNGDQTPDDGKCMTVRERRRAKRGLLALLQGFPSEAVEQLMDGDITMVCRFCKCHMHPTVHNNNDILCGQCDAILYDGEKDQVRR